MLPGRYGRGEKKKGTRVWKRKERLEISVEFEAAARRRKRAHLGDRKRADME